jgi:hypothetical protein
MRPAFARLSYPIGILCGVALLAPAANACDSPPKAGDPVITKASILTPTVNVAKAPGQPAIDVTFKTGASGLYYIYYDFEGPAPSDAQSSEEYVYFDNGLTSGTTKIQQLFTALGRSFNFYSAPGTWTLYDLEIGDNADHCTYYEGATLTALLPHATIDVVNSGTPDTQAPKVSAAHIETPTVSRSAANAWVRVNITVSDNLSGVAEAYADFKTSSSNYLNPGIDPPYPVLNGVVTAATLINPSVAKGTYKVDELYVCDAASNCADIDAVPTLNKIFGGKTTFQITD